MLDPIFEKHTYFFRMIQTVGLFVIILIGSDMPVHEGTGIAYGLLLIACSLVMFGFQVTGVIGHALERLTENSTFASWPAIVLIFIICVVGGLIIGPLYFMFNFVQFTRVKKLEI